MNMDCQFCEEFETKVLTINNEKISRILFSSENFVVFPSLGQIVEGYLLIASKRHYLSIAQIPNNLYDELEGVKNKIREVLNKSYQTPLFFEHGPISKYEKAGCCISHAHIQAIPLSINILEDLAQHFEYEKINNFVELPKQTPYLFLENNEKQKYVFPVKTILPSQYLRQVIAVKLGCPEKWDWRQYHGIKELKNTIRKLEGKF